MLAMGTSEGGWELTVLSLALEVAEPSLLCPLPTEGPKCTRRRPPGQASEDSLASPTIQITPGKKMRTTPRPTPTPNQTTGVRQWCAMKTGERVSYWFLYVQLYIYIYICGCRTYVILNAGKGAPSSRKTTPACLRIYDGTVLSGIYIQISWRPCWPPLR